MYIEREISRNLLQNQSKIKFGIQNKAEFYFDRWLNWNVFIITIIIKMIENFIELNQNVQ